MNFSIGEKVVFIEKQPFKGCQYLKKNKIYTITRINTCRCGNNFIEIAESSDPTSKCYCSQCGFPYYNGRWYNTWMFRKLLDEEKFERPNSEKEFRDRLFN